MFNKKKKTEKNEMEDQKDIKETEDTTVDVEIVDSVSEKSEKENESNDKIEEVEIELTEEEKLAERVAELEDSLMRKAAEFENYRKRMVKKLSEMTVFANERILLEMLEVVDNFDRSFEHDNGNGSEQSFKDGVQLIYNQMKNLLDKHQVKPFDAVGTQFDPNLHEALMQTDSEEYEEGVVALEVAKGYMIGDRVLRHSKVGVSKGVPKEDNKEENNKVDEESS